MSTKLSYEKLNNTRDLGGMASAFGGKILPGRLIRSGRLFSASESDKERLAQTVDLIIDFRSAQELREGPDPEIPGAEHIHIPAFRERQTGVSREEETEREAMRMVFEDPDASMRLMKKVYGDFVADEYVVSQYRRFAGLLLEGRERAILWHCTAGKDRAGFAAVIAQALLGVDREAIMEDYLLTNDNIKDEVEGLVAMVARDSPAPSARAEKAARLFFSAQEDYLHAVYEKADELYGGFEGFLSLGLGVTDAQREQLREMYLR